MYNIRAIVKLLPDTLVYTTEIKTAGKMSLDKLNKLNTTEAIDVQLLLFETIHQKWYRLDADYMPTGTKTLAAYFLENGDKVIREAVEITDEEVSKRAKFRTSLGNTKVKFKPCDSTYNYRKGGHLGQNTPNLLIEGDKVDSGKFLMVVSGITLPVELKRENTVVSDNAYLAGLYTRDTQSLGVIDLTDFDDVYFERITADSITVSHGKCHFQLKNELTDVDVYPILLLNGKFLPYATTPEIDITGNKTLSLNLSTFDLANHYLELAKIFPLDLPVTKVDGSSAVELAELYKEDTLKKLFSHFTTSVVFIRSSSRLEFKTTTIHQTLLNRFPIDMKIGGVITDSKARALSYDVRVADKWSVIGIAPDSGRALAWGTGNSEVAGYRIDDSQDVTTRSPHEDLTLYHLDLRTLNWRELIIEITTPDVDGEIPLPDKDPSTPPIVPDDYEPPRHPIEMPDNSYIIVDPQLPDKEITKRKLR